MKQNDLNSTILKVLETFLAAKTNGSYSPILVQNVQELAIGHIHRTFRVQATVNDLEKTVLIQQFATSVFTEFQAVASNTKVIVDALIRDAEYSSRYSISEPLITAEGAVFIEAEDGTMWRCFTYIPDTQVHMNAASAEVVYHGICAFTDFQRAVSTIDSSRIADPLPGYMDNPGRFLALVHAVRTDTLKRVTTVKKELEFIEQHQRLFQLLNDLKKQGDYQPRITHGDMKLNNILFDATSGLPKAVIDLDTCMVGDYLYDYGDFMRVACSSATEDESDLSKVSIDESYLKSAVEGILERMHNVLTAPEKNALPYAPATLALTVGARFLTDYLQGDTYFKVKFPEQNLVRARNQLHLCKQFIAKKDVIQQTITTATK